MVSTSIPSAGKMHGLSLSRGFRNGECDVVSNSQLKVDISRRDPIASRRGAHLSPASFPSLTHSVDPPLQTRLPIPYSACSPNINSCRLCGIRNFPTVFSANLSIRARPKPAPSSRNPLLLSSHSFPPSDLLSPRR